MATYRLVTFWPDGPEETEIQNFATGRFALSWFRRTLVEGVPVEMWCGEELVAQSSTYRPTSNPPAPRCD